MNANIDITEEQRKILVGLLRRYLPDVEVWAYGSRVKWTARPNSDLDLVAFAEPSLESQVADLKDAISESDLPFLVDLHVWDDVPERFHKIIKKEYVVIQEKQREPEDVGLPPGWEHVRLGELVEIKHGWPFKSELYSEELTGKPIVMSIGNFNYSGGLRLDSTSIKEYRGSFPDDYALHGGEVLLVMTCQTAGGEILGVPGRIPDDGRIYLHNQRLGKVVVRDERKCDLSFLYWLFLFPAFKRELVNSATGTKILHTAPTRIEAFEFSLPPLEEQRSIARILWTLEKKIELNRRMNETLEATAHTLFQSWFVDFDPVRAKSEAHYPTLPAHLADLFPDSFDDSPFGPIPHGWSVVGLDEIATFRNGLALQKFPAGDNGSLPAIKIAQLRAGNTENADRVSKDVPSEYLVNDGDVLFSWSGSLECIVWTSGLGALNQHLFKVTSERYPKWFYYRWIQYHLPGFKEIAAGKATTMGHIQRHHLHEALVVVPPPDFIRAANDQLMPLLQASISAKLENRKLTALRDSLLPKLISGELRVDTVAGESSKGEEAHHEQYAKA